MSTPPAPWPTRMRATNADRDRVAALIAASVADGALTPEEGEGRVDAVRAAVHRDEFDALLADLPVAAAPATVRDTAAPASPGAIRALMQQHRIMSIVIACVIAILVVGGVTAAGFAAFDGGHHDRGVTQDHRQGDRNR